MQITLRAEVTEVRKTKEYTSDYTKQVDKIYSTLSILKNNDGITGSIQFNNEFKFGSIHQIIVNTEPEFLVVEKKEIQS